MITIKRSFRPGRGMIRPEELTGYVFSPEVAAHTFIITKMEKVDGQETAVPFDAGTDISCRFIKANGVTELVDGDLTDDGAASVTLPAECYQEPGRFILSIYAETSEETICIYSATATALAGDTEEINVSGNTKRTIDAQIDALNDAVENAQETVEQVQEVIDSIPQDYTALSNQVVDLKSAVSGLFINDPLDISAIEPTRGYVASNMKWNSSNGYGDSIPVTQGMKKLTVKAGENAAVLTFLASDTLVSGETVTVTSTLGREIVTAGETQVFDIPDDCVMIRLQTKSSSGVDNTPESMVFDKQIMQAADNAAVQANFEAVNAKMPMPEIVVPYVFRWCVGKQCNFYYQNAVKNFDIRRAVYCRVSAWSSFNEFARWQPGSAASGRGANFNVFPYNMSNAVGATIHYDAVAADAGSGLTKTVMLIGDSLTENAPMSRHLVDDLFADDAMSIKLIGTKGTAPYRREGRSGWSPSDYVRHASLDNGSTTVNNPFYNPTSQTFDFGYYMQNNRENIGLDSGEDIDYVFLCLGTNISSEDYEISVDDMIDDMEIMVQSILAYGTAQNRTIRVGVWTPPPRALVSKANLPDHNNTMTRVKAIIDAFDNRWNSNIYVVPVGYNVDPYHDFNTQSVNISERNSRYQMDVLVDGDFTHPADEGYFKMADVIYCMIKYFGSLDAV